LILRHFGLLEVGRHGGGGLLSTSGLSHAISSCNKISSVRGQNMCPVTVNYGVLPIFISGAVYWDMWLTKRPQKITQ